MDTNIKEEPLKHRFGIKRPKSMGVLPNTSKKPRMKHKATEAIRFLLNLLQSKEKRKLSFTETSSGPDNQNSINNNALSSSPSLLKKNLEDRMINVSLSPDRMLPSCDRMSNANLSKSLSYCSNNSFEGSKYEDCLNNEDGNNNEGIYFCGSYFEDDYCQDYHGNMDEDFVFVEQPGFCGIEFEASILQSVNSTRLCPLEVTLCCGCKQNSHSKSSDRRQTSLPYFTANDGFPSPMLTSKDIVEDSSRYDTFKPYYHICQNIMLDEMSIHCKPLDILPLDGMTKSDFLEMFTFLKNLSIPSIKLFMCNSRSKRCVSICGAYTNNQYNVLEIISRTANTKLEDAETLFNICTGLPKDLSGESSEPNFRTQFCFYHSNMTKSFSYEESKNSNTEIQKANTDTLKVIPNCPDKRFLKQSSIELGYTNFCKSISTTVTHLEHVSEVSRSCLKSGFPLLTATASDLKKVGCTELTVGSSGLNRSDDTSPKIARSCLKMSDCIISTIGQSGLINKSDVTCPETAGCLKQSDCIVSAVESSGLLRKSSLASPKTAKTLNKLDCILSTLHASSSADLTKLDVPSLLTARRCLGQRLNFQSTRSPLKLPLLKEVKLEFIQEVPEVSIEMPCIAVLLANPTFVKSHTVNSQTVTLECEQKVGLPFVMACNFTKENTSFGNAHKLAIPECVLKRSTEHCSADTTSGNINCMGAQSFLPASRDLDANGNCTALPHQNSTVFIESTHTEQESTPVNRIPTPLSTSSPMHHKHAPSGTKQQDLLLPNHNISPVRRNSKMLFNPITYSSGLKKRRRLRRNIYQHHRFHDINNNPVGSSDDELEGISPCRTDYILLKKAADFLFNRIPARKEMKSLINMTDLVDYLNNFYLDQVSKLCTRSVKTISEYACVMIEFCNTFKPDRLTEDNCLLELLISVLLNRPSIFEACCDFVYENLYFLASDLNFLKIPPELLLLLLSNDHSIILGHHGFPLPNRESEQEMQRTVKKYLWKRKSCNFDKDSHLNKLFSSILNDSSSLKFKHKLPETDIIPMTKRPYHEIRYQHSEKFVIAQNTRQEYLFQPYLFQPYLSVFSSYLTDSPKKSPDSTAPSANILNFCNSSHTLRKIYFSYRLHNKVPYVTQIEFQYAVRRKRVMYSIGKRCEPKSNPEGTLLNPSQNHKLTTEQKLEAQSLTEAPEHLCAALGETGSNLSATLGSSADSIVDDDSIISHVEEESKLKMTAVKFKRGEHVTGIMVQGNSVLHNIMIHTNKGRHVRAHGIVDFPRGRDWTLIPPPEQSKYCLQAMYADARTTSTRTYIRDVVAVWAVLSFPLNN